MLTVGVALFATFSGFLANAFLSPKRKAAAPEGSDQLAELRALLEQQEETTARIRTQLEQLEASG